MRWIKSVLLGLLAVTSSFTTLAQLSPTYSGHLEIASQPLDRAIYAWAQQTGYQVLLVPDPSTKTQIVPAVIGNFSPEEGLRALLINSGYRYRRISERTVTLVRDDASAPKKSTEEPDRPAKAEDRGDHPPSSSTSDANPKSGGEKQHNDVEKTPEVIVSAEKRDERLQDVPVPVSALSADRLLTENKLRLADYYTSVPGLSLEPGSSSQILSIRGLSTGSGANPTVGIVIDDVPFGASTSLGGGAVVPDIDPGDLERVEVLRGPQGTLYGANSMGGLLKFVTVDPSGSGWTGALRGGVSGVYNGHTAGYNIRGSVNMPIGETFAIRASAFSREDPGYVDNPILNIRGINEQDVSGGRLSAMWRPSTDLSLKVSALYQDNRSKGFNDVEYRTGLGDLQQDYVRGFGRFDGKVQAYSANLNARFLGMDFVSLTGYNINTLRGDALDYTSLFATLTPGQFGVSGTVLTGDNTTKKFTQELRLSGAFGSIADWTLGGFYTHEVSSNSQDLLAVDTDTGADVGSWLHLSGPTSYREIAGFADLTFRVTDLFDVQFGGRGSEINQSSAQTQEGPYVPVLLGQTSPLIIPEADSKSGVFTYLVTPRLKLSQDFMLYARLASGYRPGGPNSAPGVPREFKPDKTQNYELGAKAAFLDQSLSVDLSIYYIDWKDIELFVLDPITQQGYTANASRAKSQGVEITVQSSPINGLRLGGWIAVNDSELTEGFPSNSTVVGNSGDRLPNAARFSGNLNADQEFPILAKWVGFIGASVTYLSEREGEFWSSPQRQRLPAYARTDIHAGSRSDTWTISAFINNVADKRALVAGGQGSFPDDVFQVIQPRTFGLDVTKSF